MPANLLQDETRRGSIRRLMAIAAGVAALAAVAPAAAGAAPATIGQVPVTTPPAICNSGPSDILQASVGTGAGYVVPSGYTRLTSWSTFAAPGAGQMLTLKVFRKVVEPDVYRVVAHDGPRALTPGVLNVFSVSLAVEPGDVLGLNDANAGKVNNACAVETGDIGDVFVGKEGVDTPDGSAVVMTSPAPGYKLNISATVTRPATIGSVQPSSGPIAGGTSVTIAGQDFTDASAVSFGTTPAASFTVNSDGSITAVSPASSVFGTVSVSVTNPAGPSSTAGTFTYKACVVPKLRGKKVKGARKALRKRGCKLGRVRGEKGGRASKQSRKAGTVLAPGSKVGIRLRKPKRQ